MSGSCITNKELHKAFSCTVIEQTKQRTCDNRQFLFVEGTRAARDITPDSLGICRAAREIAATRLVICRADLLMNL